MKATAPASHQPPAPKRFWSPGSAITIAVVLFVAAQIIGGLVISVYPLLRHWSDDRTNAWINGAYVQFVYVVLAEGLTVAGLLWFMGKRRITLRALGWNRFRAMYIAYALLGFGVYFVAYLILLSAASALIPSLNINQQQDIGFSQVAGFAQLSVTFLSLVVLPPLVEETLFRGFLFTSFRRRLSLRVALLLTSVLFAAPHLLESESGSGLLWVGAIDTFTLSVVLCYIREKTGTLWSGVLIHALKNGIAFLSLYIFVGR